MAKSHSITVTWPSPGQDGELPVLSTHQQSGRIKSNTKHLIQAKKTRKLSESHCTLLLGILWLKDLLSGCLRFGSSWLGATSWVTASLNFSLNDMWSKFSHLSNDRPRPKHPVTCHLVRYRQVFPNFGQHWRGLVESGLTRPVKDLQHPLVGWTVSVQKVEESNKPVVITTSTKTELRIRLQIGWVDSWPDPTRSI